MKHVATLLLFLALVGFRSQAQPTANTTTLAPQLYTGQYITIPATAFSGTAPSGMTFTQFFLTQFPQNAIGLKVTPKNQPTQTYTTFPSQGIQLAATSAGRPDGTIQVLPRTPPSSGNDTIRIFYILYATGSSGSAQTSVACVFVPITTVPLNVSLERFAAEVKGASTQLEWATGSEEGLDRFEVEWSGDLADWRVVNNIAALGAGAKYTWHHETPAGGANFYRLRSVSHSGASSFSNVVRVDHVGRVALITASPNPTRDFLRIEGPAGSIASLFDLGGKEVGRLQLSQNSTMSVQHLASGMYQLTVRSAAGSMLAQERIVKP